MLCLLLSMLFSAPAKAELNETELRRQISILADPKTQNTDAQNAKKIVVGSGSQAIPGLLELLSREFPNANIIEALGEIDDNRPTVITALLNYSSSYNREIRITSLKSLLMLGSKGANPAIERLMAWLSDPFVDPELKKTLIYDIYELGELVIPYLDQVISAVPGDPSLRHEIARTIGNLKATTSGSITLLKQLLAPYSSKDDAEAALSAIEELSEKAVEFTPLITALSNRLGENKVRDWNIEGAIKSLGAGAGPALIISLREGDSLWKSKEQNKLFVPIGLTVIPGLIELAGDKSATKLARRRAVQSLDQIARGYEDSISIDQNLAANATQKLREIGYLDLLERIILENTDIADFRSASGLALINFGTKDPAKLNAAFLVIEDVELDLWNPYNLNWPPSTLNRLSPALIKTMQKGTDKKIVYAAEIITRYGTASKKIAEAISQAIRNIENRYDDTALGMKRKLLSAYSKSLGDNGSIDVSLLNDIILRRENFETFSNLLEILMKRPVPIVKKFIPGLITVITSSDTQDQYKAIDLLEKVGVAAIDPVVTNMKQRKFTDVSAHIKLLGRLIEFESAQNALIETVEKSSDIKDVKEAAEILSIARKEGSYAILLRISSEIKSVQTIDENVENLLMLSILLSRFPIEDTETITYISDLLHSITPTTPLQRKFFLADAETDEEMAQVLQHALNINIGGQLALTLSLIAKRHEAMQNTVRLDELRSALSTVETFRQRYPIEFFKAEGKVGYQYSDLGFGRFIVDISGNSFKIDDFEITRYMLSFQQFDNRILKPMRISIRNLDNIKTFREAQASLWRSFVKYGEENPTKFWSTLVSITVVGGFTLIWLILYWLRPLTLLSLASFVKLSETINVKGLALRSNLLADLLIYRPRVLDAWVHAYLHTAEEAFAQLDTVRARRIHIPLPVGLDGETVADLTPEQLRPIFSRNRALLLIHGEGGSGKTSLACQIALWSMSEKSLADHAMLPIIVEHDIEAVDGDSAHPLIRVIQGLLSRVYDMETDIPIELLGRLMRRGRLLVIVDHLSEMNESSRNIINPASAGFPANALIVTSRQRETLGNTPMSRIMPTRIAGGYVSDFLGAYLRHLDRRQDFDDPIFFDACAKLTRVVNDRDVTVLLAKIYADQLVIALDSGNIDNIASNVPGLMLDYVMELNRNRADSDPSSVDVIADIKIIAWTCLKKTGRPIPAARNDILSAMTGVDNEVRLKYIQEKLQLLHAPDPSGTRLTFVLDPVAEYFAAMLLFDDFDSEDPCASANTFLDALPSPANEIEGFLFSIRDCSNAFIQDTQVASEFARRITSLVRSNNKEEHAIT